MYCLFIEEYAFSYVKSYTVSSNPILTDSIFDFPSNINNVYLSETFFCK